MEEFVALLWRKPLVEAVEYGEAHDGHWKHEV
jgi:hypothetical protein